MSERVEHKQVPDRLVCPNCPADYPAPFSRQYITCRGCGTSFLAPEEAHGGATEGADWRSAAAADDGVHEVTGDDRRDERNDDRVHRSLRTVQESASAIALSFNGAAFCFWLAGVVSFEIAAMTMLLVMNGFVVQDRFWTPT